MPTVRGAGRDGEHLLEVIDLRAEFRTARGRLPAVDGVGFTLGEGESLAIVGESGSGKSAAALSLLRLLPDPPGRITGGRVLLRGVDLLSLPEERLRDVRGGEMAMIFQEPATALNPVMTVGEQVAEAVIYHRRVRRSRVRAEVVEALGKAGVPHPERRLGHYPHQLSGGLKQRVMIAMALASKPSLLVADEPTTALDVTVQARLLDLLAYLQRRLGLAILLITHDLGVVARVADRVGVMYAGWIVESAPVGEFFRRPVHPYSRGLIDAARLELAGRGRLAVIDGAPPDLSRLPPGCRFAPRCRWRKGAGGRMRTRAEACETRPPPVIDLGERHTVRCFLAAAGTKERS